MEFDLEYNVADSFYAPIRKAGSPDFAATGDWTPAAGDVKVSKDGGNVANIATLPVAVGGAGSILWKFTFSAAELSAKKISVQIVDAATKAVDDQSFLITTYGNASAQHALNKNVAEVAADVKKWLTVAPNALVSGRVDSRPGALAANVITAAAINAAAITAAKFAAGAIDAAAIATDAIGSAELSSAAANKIRDTIISDATAFAGANIALIKTQTDKIAGQHLQQTTIATLATQTSFTLAAGSADNDAYNGALIVVTDSATAVQKAVGQISDYVGVSKTITLIGDPAIFTMAVGDTVDIIAVAKQLDDLATILVDTADMQPKLGTPAADLAADVAAVKVDTAATLVDTADMQPKLGTPAADLAADVAAVKVDSAAILVDTAAGGAGPWTTGSGTGLTPLAAGTAQAGTASTIQLAASETFADDELNGNVVKITAGTGKGQSRVIIDYANATDTATVSPNWTTNPSSDSVYEVVPGSSNVAAVSNVGEDLPTATALALVQTDTTAILADTADMQPKLGAPAADLAADVAAVKVDSAAILVDTADIQPKIGAPAADLAADVAAVKVDTAATLVDTAEMQGKLPTNNIMGSAVKTDKDDEIDAVKAKTDLLAFTGGNLHSHTKVQDNLALTAQQKIDVEKEADDAIVANHLDHVFKTDYDPAAKPGVATALFNELIESDGGVSRYTANALEQAPGSSLTKLDVAKAWRDQDVHGTAINDGSNYRRFFGEKKTATGAGFEERGTIVSGNITKALNPDMGAIFTSMLDAAPDLYYGPDLVGMEIVNDGATSDATKRNYVITGGFFFTKGSPGTVSKVFGIAKKMGVVNGAVTASNGGLAKAGWAGTNINEDSAGTNGWTFITYALPGNDSDFPLSLEDLHLEAPTGMGNLQSSIEEIMGTASIDAIVDAVWNELLSGHVLAGSFGKALADIETDVVLIRKFWKNKNDFLLVTGSPDRWYWRVFDDDNSTEIFRKEVFKHGGGVIDTLVGTGTPSAANKSSV